MGRNGRYPSPPACKPKHPHRLGQHLASPYLEHGLSHSKPDPLASAIRPGLAPKGEPVPKGIPSFQSSGEILF